jgi:putative ABC transport system permease protein
MAVPGTEHTMNEAPRFIFFRLVVRNLRSRPYRNLAMVIVFAVLAAALFSAQYLASGAAESLDHGTGWLGADLILVPGDSGAAGEASLLTGQPSMFFFNDTGIGAVSEVPGVARVSPQILIASLSGQSCCSGYVQVIAIDPATDFSLTRWLDTEYGVPLGKDGIIIGSTIEGDIGSDLRFYGHPFHITGKLVPTGMGGIDSAVFIRIEDAMVMAAESPEKAAKPLTIPPGMVSWVLVQLVPGASPGDTGMLIRQKMPGTRVITPDDLSTIVTVHLSGMILVLQTAAVVVALAAVPVLLIVSVMLAREVNEEVTLLGALGTTRAFVLRLILAESFAASVLGALAGIAAALLVLVAFQDLIIFTLGIPFSIPSLPALILAAGRAFLLTIMLGGLLSLYPTYRVLRSEPYRAIRS